MINLIESSTIITTIYNELEMTLKNVLPDYSIDIGNLSFKSRDINDIESADLTLYISNKKAQLNKNNYPCINTIAIRFDINTNGFNGRNFHFNIHAENEVIDLKKSNFVEIGPMNCIAIPTVDGDIDCPFITSCHESIPNINTFKNIEIRGRNDDNFMSRHKFKLILLELVFE